MFNELTLRSYERFAIADRIILTRREALAQQVPVDENAITVVMSHNYFDDLEALKHLLSFSACYIGVMCGRSRTERLLQQYCSLTQTG